MTGREIPKRRDARSATVAVTGLNATDNPGPGVAVIRALRADPDFRGRIVGLAYDSLDPGIYARDLCDDVFLVPYPSRGSEALLGRLDYIARRVGAIDALIPTLDAELAGFIALEPQLRRRGVHTLLPSRAQLDARSKVNLAELGAAAGFDVPHTCVLSSPRDLYTLHEQIPFPLVIKGLYYGATVVHDVTAAFAAFHRIVAEWGYPVIAQQLVAGEELDVLAVGNGDGGLVGALPMKKTTLTDKGKGWAGVTVRDPHLLELAARFVEHTQWRGPCEVEVMRTRDGRYYVIEINPRFPAWCYLSAGAGMNLPYAVLRLALGDAVEPLCSYEVGTMFVRIALDQIASLEQLSAITQHGELAVTSEERVA
ncbi:MAG: ATP-grasp domain-containing protein [Myxococcales bacterium]|nr:ATP-grasp domain-containing protein [Myxococcales bacterium]